MKKSNLCVGDIMNTNSVTITLGSSMQVAVDLVFTANTNDLMVVDNDGNFIGVLSEGDLIRAAIPDFEELMSSSEGSFEQACEILFKTGMDLEKQIIDRFIVTNAITLNQDDELLKASVVMVNKQIRRLPVVKDKKFIGTVSRADICRAILTQGKSGL